MEKSVKKSKETPRFYISLARVFQNLAYICLFVGCVAFLATIVGLVITFWPQPEPSSSSGYVTDPIGGWSGVGFWAQALFMFNPYAIIFQIIIGVLLVLLVIWGWRFAIRTMRRLTWRLADEIMKPLAIVEPILLLIVWAITVVGSLFIVEAEVFLTISFSSLIFLAIGLLCFLAMRKLAGKYLDFTRAELVLGRR
ncbi:MAG: hypothetical protein LBQ11_02905 [Candidatus Nomurabacteria bacterium]|jgi:membrane protein CcdC involved in cytochrome C biogenesis|nr:hypothetical protein [Candidatus Nomurabacteria bacterium]